MILIGKGETTCEFVEDAETPFFSAWFFTGEITKGGGSEAQDTVDGSEFPRPTTVWM